MSIKLHYIDKSGIAEAIRYMLHYSGQEFEDIRYDSNTWQNSGVKESFPYHQVPFYEEGSRKINQSFAISRYVASKANLLPVNVWEQAILDAVVLNTYDFRSHIKCLYLENDPEKKEKIRQKIFEEHIDFYFSRLEKELKENNGHYGQKLSWADFVVVGLIESTNKYLNIKVEENYPALTLLKKKIHSLPGVKEFLKNRKPYEPY